MLEKLSSAIYNNINTGIKGANVNNPLTLEQIEDSIISERLLLIKEYSQKGLLPVNDLAMSINCLEVDCNSLHKCCTNKDTSTRHIEVPQIINDFGNKGILYLGAVDRQLPFIIYTDHTYKYHKHRRSKKKTPYVWLDVTPNANNKNDIYIFGAPLLQVASITAVFKDPRQVLEYGCCSNDEVIHNFSFIDKEIEKRVSNQYIEYYRRLAIATTPNDQAIK